MVALFIIRLTAASATPSCFWSVRCTRDWHAAQVIPETGTRSVSRSTPPLAPSSLRWACPAVGSVAVIVPPSHLAKRGFGERPVPPTGSTSSLETRLYRLAAATEYP